MKKLVSHVGIVLVAVAALLVPTIPAAAAASQSHQLVQTGVDDFTFAEYNAVYDLRKSSDGTSHVEVSETFVATFPEFDQNKGIVREIPLIYDDLPLEIDFLGIKDGNDEPIAYYTNEEDGVLTLEIGDETYLRGEHTFVLNYIVHDVVRYFPKTDSYEFYWNTNGGDWNQSFNSASVTVNLDEAITSDTTGDFACYLGTYGETQQCDMQQNGTSYNVGPVALNPHENITVAIGFTEDAFVVPTDTVTPTIQIFGGAAIGGGLVLSIFLLVMRRKAIKSGPQGSGVVVAEYSSPKERDLSVLAWIIDTPSKHQLLKAASPMVASLLRMAVERQITLFEHKTQSLFGISKTFAFAVHQNKELSLDDAQTLSVLTTSLPRSPEGYPLLKDSSGKVAAKLTAMKATAKLRAAEMGYITKAPKPTVALVILGTLYLAGLLALGLFFFFITPDATPAVGWVVAYAFAGFFVGSMILTGISSRGYVLTEKGAELKDYLAGVKLYIEVAEKDRIAFLQSVKGAERREGKNGSETIHLFEELLPIATLLGLEKSWGDTLTAVYQDFGVEPQWSSGIGTANIGAFASSFANTTKSSITSPSSGGSGGAGGGGSSGGGGGGGGGGGR